jgi:DNA polymerase III psi subunit
MGIKDFSQAFVEPKKSINYMFLEPILTLHQEELDQIKADELDLLNKVLQSSGNNSLLERGTLLVEEDATEFDNNMFRRNCRVIIDFTRTFNGSNVIAAPSLEKLLQNQDLKKNLWQQMLYHLKSK